MAYKQLSSSLWRAGLRIKATALLLLLAAIVLAAPAQAFTQESSTSHLPSLLPVGTVISSSAATLPTDLQALATGKYVKYISTDQTGNKIVVSGLIITPLSQPLLGKTVAWAHGTTGWGDQCAPSTNLNVFWPEAVEAIKSYLQQGWTVAASDYPGLGTAGAHPYLMGESEARSVINSVRAARNLNLRLGSQYVVSGHSQGAQAALFAGEIADTYDGLLNLKGVVAMAPPSNFDIIGPAIVGTPGQGLLVGALLGLEAVDPSVNIDTILAQPAKDRLPIFDTGCYYDVVGVYAQLTADDLLIGGELPQIIVDKLAQNGNPAQQASSAPILMTQGSADMVVPTELTQLLQSQVCAHGTRSFLQIVEGGDHEDAVAQTITQVRDYIAARFTSLSAPTNC